MELQPPRILASLLSRLELLQSARLSLQDSRELAATKIASPSIRSPTQLSLARRLAHVALTRS